MVKSVLMYALYIANRFDWAVRIPQVEHIGKVQNPGFLANTVYISNIIVPSIQVYILSKLSMNRFRQILSFQN